MKNIVKLFQLNPLKYYKIGYFCAHEQIKNQMIGTFKYHKQILKNPEQSARLFTKDYLLKLTQSNYSFADLVDICRSLISQDGKKSDEQILFICYVYNLYYSDLKRQKIIGVLVAHCLQTRISEDNFGFQNEQVEKYFLLNVKILANRHNSYIEVQISKVKRLFLKFIAIKYEIIDQNGKYQQICEKTLYNIDKFTKYIPSQNGNMTFLDAIEKYSLQILQYQFTKLTIKTIFDKDYSHQRLCKRLTVLMEAAIIISRIQDKYINIFQFVPKRFETQNQFRTMLKILKEIITYQVLKRIDFQQLDSFNEEISRENKNYRQAQTVKVFEQYVEGLIYLKIINLKPFIPYFYSDQEFDSKEKIK